MLNLNIKGVGGRLGVGSSFSAYVRKITALEKVENMEDPREAVLKYAKVYCIICMYVHTYTTLCNIIIYFSLH